VPVTCIIEGPRENLSVFSVDGAQRLASGGFLAGTARQPGPPIETGEPGKPLEGGPA